ncbi:MAG TPA: YegS/Rv2252/BmrU family lipid kinase [Bacteroidia bacterium]|nr:YegS/Rv2252/BmrU family lipid kinase [Bacteroidia bacterium]
MQRHLLFIVNPNAGKKKSGEIIKVIQEHMNKAFPYHIHVWENKNDFDTIRNMLLSGTFTDAVAVGGDGTVNKVASAIRGTGIRLGILPAGSGNGLARTLNISMDFRQALKQITSGQSQSIDSGVINGRDFFCTSGVGFDAHIAFLFSKSVSRGLWSYVKITLGQLYRYKPESYSIQLKDQVLEKEAFLITVANAGQYGNDFYIAPEAKTDDGLFHVVLLKPWKFYELPLLFTKILLKKAHTCKQIETYTSDQVTIIRHSEGPVHFDGEPDMQGRTLAFSLHHNTLQVICG